MSDLATSTYIILGHCVFEIVVCEWSGPILYRHLYREYHRLASCWEAGPQLAVSKTSTSKTWYCNREIGESRAKPSSAEAALPVKMATTAAPVFGTCCTLPGCSHELLAVRWLCVPLVCTHTSNTSRSLCVRCHHSFQAAAHSGRVATHVPHMPQANPNPMHLCDGAFGVVFRSASRVAVVLELIPASSLQTICYR